MLCPLWVLKVSKIKPLSLAKPDVRTEYILDDLHVECFYMVLNTTCKSMYMCTRLHILSSTSPYQSSKNIKAS